MVKILLSMSETATRYRFGRNRRLRGRRAFSQVYAERVRQIAGPLTVYSRPNGLTLPRLGLSVSASVGSAVRRNRIKRLIREAFRLGQHDWPAAYDLIVVVRRHEPATLGEYQRLLSQAGKRLHGVWESRSDGAVASE